MQELLKEAAVEAGRFERKISVDDVGPTIDKARADGIEVVNLSQQDLETFKDLSKEIYVKYENFFSEGLLDNIKKH
jgi:TRAP-type C4-dicarboxylate transport system substrate-binding protein